MDKNILNATLINAQTDHFKILNFINVNLTAPVLWSSHDFVQDENIGITFDAYDKDLNEKQGDGIDAGIGYIMIADTTNDESEKDISKMNDKEIKHYDKFLENVYREMWGEQFFSWSNYEISKTKQDLTCLITKCIINEPGVGKKFDYTLRTTFKNKTIYASAAVKEKNLFFMKYYHQFKNIIDNIYFD